MIELTRLNGSKMIVNSDQILWIECSPDTVLTLAHGEKLFVRESPGDVVDRVKAFKRAVAMGSEGGAVLTFRLPEEERS